MSRPQTRKDIQAALTALQAEHDVATAELATVKADLQAALDREVGAKADHDGIVATLTEQVTALKSTCNDKDAEAEQVKAAHENEVESLQVAHAETIEARDVEIAERDKQIVAMDAQLKSPAVRDAMLEDADKEKLAQIDADADAQEKAVDEQKPVNHYETFKAIDDPRLAAVYYQDHKDEIAAEQRAIMADIAQEEEDNA